MKGFQLRLGFTETKILVGLCHWLNVPGLLFVIPRFLIKWQVVLLEMEKNNRLNCSKVGGRMF